LTLPLHKTKGVVLRVTKYGESSIITLIYTEQFGIQSYLVQGVRVTSHKKNYQASYFQPGALLDLVVYHHDQKSLQRIKEFKWSYLYESLLFDVVKNSILLYIIELVTKTIKQPETNTDLFAFIEDALIWLDQCLTETSANFPIYFALHFSSFFGFQMSNDPLVNNNILDLINGKFISDLPNHTQLLQGEVVLQLKELIKVMHPDELIEIPLNRLARQEILDALEKYYSIHISEFGKMKTLPILKQLMD
jgi:DNA repair protein RecO (recombination protein O)